ncbi:DUF2156 domain-containing protein [Leucobacter insecticola]|uniref:DUF2156 domain-containing protein n=1 Tax=Leucobacter insecticola TaxID=2714934 RepID=A0A6G8FGE8_9MICO|nr:DUF2156 domain-containing protein [Leucobacter insecticola]QIM15434.1 DUF2156 domain-containing protein [Leucobacter insecticola]
MSPCQLGEASLRCADTLHWDHGPALIGAQVLVSLFLLLCAWGLLLGKRVALWATVAISGAAGIAVAVRLLTSTPAKTFPASHGPEALMWQISGALIPLALAAVLIWQRRAFPPRPRSGDTAQTRKRAELLRLNGTSLSWMAGWSGNQTFVTADRRNAVAFRAVGGFAITVSDPFGAGDMSTGSRATIEEFIAYCDRVALQPVFYSIHDAAAQHLREAGWSTLTVAEETIFDPANFTLSGKRAQDLRTAVNRANRTGLRTRIASWSELPLRITTQITNISEEWVANKDLPELSFTLGGLDEMQEKDVLLAIVLDDEDSVLAVTSWLPFFSDGTIAGRTLDVMRRRGTVPNGTMEYLITSAIQHFAEEGLARVSLSGSPLAHTTDAADSTLDRLMQLLSRGLEPAYGFRSLARFKAKFSANSEPMYLAYRDPLALPAIGLALGRCYLPTVSARQLAALLRSK